MKQTEQQFCPHCGTEFTKEKHNLTLLVNVNKSEEQPEIQEEYYKCKDCGKKFRSTDLIIE